MPHFVKPNHDIDNEKSYEYKGCGQKCKFNPSTVGANLTGYSDLKSGDENILIQAIATISPIFVVIDANFDMYGNILLARKEHNMCRIARQASYSIV